MLNPPKLQYCFPRLPSQAIVDRLIFDWGFEKKMRGGSGEDRFFPKCKVTTEARVVTVSLCGLLMSTKICQGPGIESV